jgi:hypothetical protein
MPDGEQTSPDVLDVGAPSDETPSGGVFSRYGTASALLALLCVAAVAVLAVIWSTHHAEAADRTQQTNAMQAAADWTGVLINMNKDNVEGSLQKLHDGTVGQLNADFEASIGPYRDVVQTLQSQTTGRIEAVAIEKIHRDLDTAPGAPAAQSPAPELPPGMAARTDTVMVVATSVSQNVGGQPQTVRWNLRLDVADVDGRLLISRLESMR